jgi:hypothetical protein
MVLSTFCHFLSFIGEYDKAIKSNPLYIGEWYMMSTLELLLTSSSVLMLMLVIYAFGQMFN